MLLRSQFHIEKFNDRELLVYKIVVSYLEGECKSRRKEIPRSKRATATNVYIQRDTVKRMLERVPTYNRVSTNTAGGEPHTQALLPLYMQWAKTTSFNVL